MNHKIVCWGDYAIPVPMWANWMAFDESGAVFVFSEKPHQSIGNFTRKWIWRSSRCNIIASSLLSISPPEPGPWTEQLYWIGD